MFYKNIRFRYLYKNYIILDCQIESKIGIVSVNIDKFCLILNVIVCLNILKKLLSNKHKIKNLKEVITIISL